MLALAALACFAAPCAAVSLSEFDSTVAALESFALSLEAQSLQEEATNAHLSADELEFVEIEAELGVDAQAQENPSYTLAYPPVSVASQAAGGFFHPYSNVNPLTAPWQGFAPVAGPAQVLSGAAIAASPATYYASALQPLAAVAPMHPALTNTFPVGDAKGGYNAHGLLSVAHGGLYHQGLSADLTSLGGKAAGGGEEGGEEEGGEEEGGEESFLEHSTSEALHNDPAEMEASAEEAAYGLFPAPTPTSAQHFVRDNMAALGPHKLQFAGIGDNEVDSDFAFVETAAATEADADVACINCSFA